MIDIFNKVLKEDSCFLKYSTAISGTGLGNKVLFFGFRNGQRLPWVVVKTVRKYGDAPVIRNGHRNLEYLHTLIKGTPYGAMFPEPLLVYDDGYIVFSAETVCAGERVNLEAHRDQILKRYTHFQKHVADSVQDTIDISAEYGKKLIRDLEGSRDTIEGLSAYLSDLWRDEHVRLSLLPQHGDMTIDNILFDNTGMKIIDCDTFGAIRIPGFDVYHLLTKGKVKEWQPHLQSHFDELGIEYAVDTKLLFIYFLHELFIKRDYILKHKSLEAVIREFEAVI